MVKIDGLFAAVQFPPVGEGGREKGEEGEEEEEEGGNILNSCRLQRKDDLVVSGLDLGCPDSML